MKRTTTIILVLICFVILGAGASYARSFLASRKADTRPTEPQERAEGASNAKGASTSEGEVGTGTVSIPAPHNSPQVGPSPEFAPGPSSLEELVASADVIVIGEVGSLADTKIFYGYDAGAAQRAELDKANPIPRLGLPVADYSVEIERVLVGNGNIALGGQLTLRVVGDPKTDSGMPMVGSRRLFFLKLNPDNATYGMSSFLDEIDITGTTTVFRQGSLRVFPFGLKLSPDEFVDRVQHEVEQRVIYPTN